MKISKEELRISEMDYLSLIHELNNPRKPSKALIKGAKEYLLTLRKGKR